MNVYRNRGHSPYHGVINCLSSQLGTSSYHPPAGIMSVLHNSSRLILANHVDYPMITERFPNGDKTCILCM